MARPAKFSRDDLLDAAAQAAAEHWRDATIAHVAQHLGAPVGSIYHRFGSREELFTSLWLRSIERFHDVLLAAAANPHPHEAALGMATCIPRFCREHPVDAIAMTLYRQQDLAQWGPESLRERVAHVNDRVLAEVMGLVERRYGAADPHRVQLMLTACQEAPYGLVRRYLRTETPIPLWLDDAVRAAAGAILALGDTETR